MQPTKSTLRQQLLAIRQNIPHAVRHQKDARLVQQLLRAYAWSSVQRLYIYQPILQLGEPDMTPFITRLRQLSPHTHIDIAPTKLGAPLPTITYDVIILPVVGYDSAGTRLGMGGGWYDRLLAAQPTAFSIGIAYRDTYVDHIPVESHDQAPRLILAA